MNGGPCAHTGEVVGEWRSIFALVAFEFSLALLYIYSDPWETKGYASKPRVKKKKKKKSLYIALDFINVVYVLGLLTALRIGHIHTFLCACINFPYTVYGKFLWNFLLLT